MEGGQVHCQQGNGLQGWAVNILRVWIILEVVRLKILNWNPDHCLGASFKSFHSIRAGGQGVWLSCDSKWEEQPSSVSRSGFEPLMKLEWEIGQVDNKTNLGWASSKAIFILVKLVASLAV